MLFDKSTARARTGRQFLAASLMMAASGVVSAHSGYLDPRFGTGGTSNVDVPAGIVFNLDVVPVAIDHSNRIIYGIPTSAGDEIGALDASGNSDASFGIGGVQMLTHNVADLAIDSHDRIVVLEGDASPLDFSTNIIISRFLSDGSIDETFGMKGTATISDSGYDLVPASIVLDKNDNAYVAGSAFPLPETGARHLLVARIANDGNIDLTFGGAGTGWTMPLPSLELSSGLAIALDDESNIFAAGRTQTVSTLGLGALIKLTPDGLLDTSSFGHGTGFVETDFDPASKSSHVATIDSIALDTSGNIVAGGSLGVALGSSATAIVRYLADGDLDHSFGTGAPLIMPMGGGNHGIAHSVMIDGRNRIVATGITGTPAGAVEFFAIRLNGDGTKDSSFGDGPGYQIVDDSAYGGRSAFTHGGNILMLGNTTDDASVVASELIGYDVPPISPPDHFPLMRTAAFPIRTFPN